MVTHPSPETLREYRDGKLATDAGASIEEHLDDCARCADVYLHVLNERATFGQPSDGPMSLPQPQALPADLQAVLTQLPTPDRPAAAPPIEPMQEIDGYAMVEEIGRGGMGVVYKAIRLAPRQIVAVKVIAGQEFPSADEVARFHREADEVLGLSAAGSRIVRVLDHGECRGRHYIAMEYVAGGSLASRLAEIVRDPPIAARIIAEVADAVELLHSRGLIHRDIKPANILLSTPAGQPIGAVPLARAAPLLSDFGLVKRVDDQQQTPAGGLLGTPDFMAPEMIRDSNKPTVASDVYSLGATLYACLTGRAPFEAATLFDTLKRVEKDYPTPPTRFNRAVPPPLQWICLKCLEKNPARRYRSAAEFAADLRRFLDPEGRVQAGPPPWWLRTGRWIKTNQRIAALGAFLGLVLVSIAALGWQAAQTADERAEREATLRETAEDLLTVQGEALRSARSLAETRAQKAEAERRRAVSERHVAHAARVTAARTLARRGDWQAALPQYTHAIDEGESDALRLRVERLVGYFALNQTDDLTAELAALNRSDLGALRAQVKLLEGAWLLCDVSQMAAGRERVQQALAARDQLFSPADVAFAEALVAPRVGATIAALRRAVEADPLHYLAGSTLAVTLASVGDLDEARRQARFLRAMFPASPMPDLAEALIALIDGDGVALKTRLADVVRRVPADRRAEAEQMQDFLMLILEIRQLGVRLMANEPAAGIGDVRKATQFLAQARKLGGIANPIPLGLPVPAVGVIYHRLFDVLTTYLEVGRPLQNGQAQPAALTRLEALYEDYPEALLLCLGGVMHVRLATEPVNRAELETARVHLAKAADLAARATNAPCILPRSLVAYTSRGLCAIADVGILKLVRAPDPVHHRRLRDDLHRLVADGAPWPKLRRPLLTMFIQMTAAPLTRAQCRDWQLDDPAGKAAYEGRMRELARLGRALLDDWAVDEPNNRDIAGVRRTLDRWASSTGIVEDRAGAPMK